MLKRLAKRSPKVISAVRFGRRAIGIMRGWDARPSTVAANQTFQLPVSPKEQVFCGYYDHSPFNAIDESLILLHCTARSAWKNPCPEVPVSIILYDWKAQKVVRTLGESFAWNWQQGARALWFDCDTVIFNVYDPAADAYHARLVRRDGTHHSDLPIPVQEIDSAGRVYSLSYEALAAIRPDYGYRNRPPDAQEFDQIGIEQIDPFTMKRRTLIRVGTLKSAAEKNHRGHVARAKFNHAMASPDATKLVFLFRYFSAGRRITDLYVMPTDGGQPSLLAGDCGVSHVCWWGSDAVVATMAGPSGFGYYIVPIRANEATLLWAQPDGHPVRLDEHHLLTDTYPDGHALRHLLIRSLESGDTAKLASFPEPLLFQGETRCDLHPSVSPSQRYIQVDCSVGGRRTVAVMPNPLFDERT